MRRLVVLVAACACGGKDPATPGDGSAPPPPVDARPDAADTTRPEIVATTPLDDEPDRPVSQTFTVTFSEPIDPATVTASAFYMHVANVPVPAAIAVAGATATLTPTAPLAIETRYNVTIDATIADLSGNTLLTDHTFRFNTVHRRRVFVTSIQNTGRLAGWPGANGKVGLAAGDAVCQARAIAANLDGAFVAWLSDDTRDAYCRVQNLPGKRSTNCNQPTLPAAAGPWVRVDGQPWADTIDAMTVYTPPLLTEFGQPTSANYFSSTSAAGVATAATCINWTSSAFGGVGYGGTRTTGTFWTQWGTTTCASFASLLCLETGTSGIALAFPAPARRAFVTSTSVAGNLGASADAGGATGLAAADAICQARATAGGLTGAFKAWLSDDTTPAPSRITADGPWTRLDGLRVAATKLDLLDGQLATTLNQTETGAYLADVQVWTNTTAAGTAAFASCTNWTVDTGALGFVGRINDSGTHWTRDAAVDCALPQRLYCLED